MKRAALVYSLVVPLAFGCTESTKTALDSFKSNYAIAANPLQLTGQPDLANEGITVYDVTSGQVPTTCPPPDAGWFSGPDSPTTVVIQLTSGTTAPVTTGAFDIVADGGAMPTASVTVTVPNGDVLSALSGTVELTENDSSGVVGTVTADLIDADGGAAAGSLTTSFSALDCPGSAGCSTGGFTGALAGLCVALARRRRSRSPDAA